MSCGSSSTTSPASSGKVIKSVSYFRHRFFPASALFDSPVHPVSFVILVIIRTYIKKSVPRCRAEKKWMLNQTNNNKWQNHIVLRWFIIMLASIYCSSSSSTSACSSCYFMFVKTPPPPDKDSVGPHSTSVVLSIISVIMLLLVQCNLDSGSAFVKSHVSCQSVVWLVNGFSSILINSRFSSAARRF